MYLTINLACVLNWHLRILAIQPVPGGVGVVQCHYVVGQEAIVGCHIRLVWKHLHLHLEFYMRMCSIFMSVYVRLYICW